MKFILTILVSLIFFNGNGQRIVEELIRINDNYSPLFGNKSTDVDIMFVMSYEHLKSDTVFNVVFQLNQLETEKQGESFSTGIFGRSIGFASSSYYSSERNKGHLTLNYQELDTLLTSFNKMYEFTKQTYGRNRIVTYSFKNLKLSVEVNYVGGVDPTGAFKSFFYLSIDDATFRLSTSQFFKLTQKTISELKKIWDDWLQNRLLPVPIYY
ncbi:hypothetical protein [Phnomibacter ginsenosidimutans]|uniref:Uncharacterized protein n=1 Tax=Phnomibacter ginsenosidimutans TaxID=2676868 RepID=A0A6I6GFA1_9BACT|nr:hypothetical protein [Phnomibacter ginsenosidimutans]QGW29110.1 hypothetical protein GLV81_14240 [Phnomibacter ginsenosidimutans]